MIFSAKFEAQFESRVDVAERFFDRTSNPTIAQKGFAHRILPLVM